MARRANDFLAIRSEGGLLPADLLRRVLDPKEKVEGTRPEDYGLPQGERLNEVITQSWNRLRKHWGEFRTAAANLPEGEPATGLTNDKWNLPLLRELGFGLLPTSAGPEVSGRTYAINRFFGPVPIHLVGCGLSLDRRAAGVRGASAVNPHGLVQEYLNRSHNHLWAIVSNGLRLRVLRDNQALSRQSFLEFDLEAMFSGEVYSDFVLLWLMAHATRFAPRDGDRPESCWLEQWTKLADEQGTRALGDLRGGVERALQTLGEGFTSHPKNTALREALRSGEVTPLDFHGQLLRIVYRLIFLFVAEDRSLDGLPLLHPRDTSDAARTARERYSAHYSTARLRELASRIKGSRHGDLWRQFQLLVGALSGKDEFAAARAQLALLTLGSFLWDPASTAALNDADLTNHDFLEALRNLAFTRQGKVLRPVDYRNLGAEELGGVYESLLALTPQISGDGAKFTFAEFAGNERKTSGSYYTPDSLVQCLLDSALDPVVEEAIKGKTGVEAEKAILALKVCDPAVGSGHFLVGAAHRLARHLARVRALAQGESEPSPLLYQHALRDVIGRCLYGVDINPMSAELCRVSLWLEAMEPGKPLSFLDHHIRVGNSLLGTTPELIAAGLPDEAFTAIEGDDKKACAVLKKRNKAEKKGLGPLFAMQDAETQKRLQQAAATLEELPDDRPEDIRAKELAFRRHELTEEYRKKKQLADTWCAAFVIEKYFTDPARESSACGITQGHLNDLASGKVLPADLVDEVVRLSGQYRFFHWHLAFPEVLVRGGFDCTLGNPPWERVKLQEKEWFAERSPEIAQASSSAIRKKLIDELKLQEPSLAQKFLVDSRSSDGDSHLIRNSGSYPLCGTGDLNLYAVFAELIRKLLKSNGRMGVVLPSGIATDDTTKLFFQDIIDKKSLVSLFDFENRNIFPSVHSSYKFCLFTCGSLEGNSSRDFDFVFFAHDVEDIRDDGNHVKMSGKEISLLNPETRTCCIFRNSKELLLALALSKRGVFLADRNGHGVEQIEIGLRVDNSKESKFFVSDRESFGVKNVPFYEGKMIHQFNHRFASYESGDFVSCSDQLLNQFFTASPCFFIENDVAVNRYELLREWYIGVRRLARSTDERTVIAAVIPRCCPAYSFNTFNIATEQEKNLFYLGALNSVCLDFLARLKLGGANLTWAFQKQLAVPKFDATLGLCRLITSIVLELTYTAWDLEKFALACNWEGPPFRWAADRRFLLRCELDAAFFHLYLPSEPNGGWKTADSEAADDLARLKASFPTPRHAVAYIMDTFPIVRRKDEEKYDGDYRTKRVILEIYDAMQTAIRTGQPYQTRLDPPPADPRCCHPPR